MSRLKPRPAKPEVAPIPNGALCALCGERPANEWTDWDCRPGCRACAAGAPHPARKVVACERCLAPVEGNGLAASEFLKGTTEARTLRACSRFDRFTSEDIINALDLDTFEASTMRSQLYALVKRGWMRVVATGRYMVFELTAEGRHAVRKGAA